MQERTVMTTGAGTPVADKQNCETAGPRDPRGFPLELNAGGGNWDLVGNNTAAFFIRDAGRHNHRGGNQDHRQAGDLYRSMNADRKSQLINNRVGALKAVPRLIQVRPMIFHKADADYGSCVALGLGIHIDEVTGEAAKRTWRIQGGGGGFALTRFMRTTCCGLTTLRVLLLVATAFNTAVAFGSQTQVAEPASKTLPAAWVVQAGAGLEPRVIDVLQRISSADRRLLALSAYLRAGGTLAERWSWSREQLSFYSTTPEGKAASADIDAVVAAFAAANPGFTLHVNREPRSLEVQIAHWNLDESVGTAAAALVAALEQRFTGNPTTPNTDQLIKALIEWNPNVATALAAPGLSMHGQGRAFDFQIERAGQVIAGVDVALASQQWSAEGWTQKLRAAVGVAGNHFVGPLESPFEPWHYSYAFRPAASDGTR